jgi:hypothetical protein
VPPLATVSAVVRVRLLREAVPVLEIVVKAPVLGVVAPIVLLLIVLPIKVAMLLGAIKPPA